MPGDSALEGDVDRPRWLGPFVNRDFRLLFAGSTISFVGDQFTGVALPWLVLQLTHDPAQLGLVFATIALPRAAFMLLGGASVDRMSPRGVLLAARSVSAVLTGLLACLVLTGAIRMWMVYALAVGMGLCGSFAYPASSAILPQIVIAEQLQVANSMLMAVSQVSMLLGPALAGLLINLGNAHARTASATHGTGLAFVVDALSFVFSVALLLGIRVANGRNARTPAEGVFSQVAAGIQTLWADRQLRAIIGYLALACLLAGPLQVGLPLFANARLGHGAAAFGWLMTATACGFLLGSLIGTPVTRLLRGRVGVMVLGADAAAGLALAGLSYVQSVPPSVALLVFIGTLGSIGQIAIMTWLQRRVPLAMMGRTMSVVMFASAGVAPVAAALAGAFLKVISLSSLFIGAGLGLTAFALFCLTRRNLRAIRLQIAPASQEPT